MDDAIQHPARWRPTLGLKGFLFGLVIGLGLAVLTQQLGWVPFETTTLILWLVAGVLLGGALASGGYVIGVAGVNRALEEDKEDTDDEDKPARSDPTPEAQG